MKIRLPRHMSAAFLETVLRSITRESPSQVVLDLTELRRARLFAEARILGILTLAERRGSKISLALGSPLPQAGDKENRYWKIFCESIAGLVMAQFAIQINDPTGRDWSLHVLDRQAATLREARGLIGSGKEIAAPVIDRFGGPAVAHVALSEDATAFGALLRELLFQRFNLPRLNEALVTTIGEFAFETMQNTRDHGLLDLDGNPIGGARFLSFRRLNLEQETLDDLIKDSGNDETPVATYLKALKDELAGRYEEPNHLLEMTIADSGIGIPARMARSWDPYEGNIDIERGHLLRALHKDGTSKPGSIAGAGLGLFNVMRACHQARGLIVFRTGRLCMYRHYLGKYNNWPSLALEDWGHSDEGLIGGTAVSLIFPWMEVGQLALNLNK